MLDSRAHAPSIPTPSPITTSSTKGADGELQDIPAEAVEFLRLPEAPAGRRIESVDIVIRVRRENP
ncbi:MAG: hypothetical protein U5L11_12975 [Arhodomonas sp.]|nr:hypothetical protein [Arhodomonas sp.]